MTRHLQNIIVAPFVLFFVCSADAALYYRGNKTNEKQSELRKVQQQIVQTTKQLQNLQRREVNQSQSLGSFRKKKQAIELHLLNLREQKSGLENALTSLMRSDSTVMTSMTTTRQNFGKYLRKLYIASLYVSDVSTDVQPIYARTIAAVIKKRLRVMNAKHDSLSRRHISMLQESIETSDLMQQKTNESKTLDNTIQKTQATLQEIRTNKDLMQQELVEKRRSAEKIRAIVVQLTEDERKREEERKVAEQKSKQSKIAAHQKKNVKIMSGLHWPINSRKIFRNYGQYRNKQTNTVMDNPGIDIAASIGTNVSAAAAGTVSLVHWLPGYNSLLIIDHENGYRTVYANLDKTIAIKGQKVAAGAPIGRTGESVAGKFLHFEVWHGTDRVNPATMLK